MLIFSKCKKRILLFSYYDPEKIDSERVDITPTETFLQCSILNKNKNFIVNPHLHKTHKRLSNKTNEAWIVIKGEIRADLYDINKKKIKTIILKKGSCLVMHNGGHALKVTKKNTVFYEIKNGPYLKNKVDKIEL